MDSSSPTMPREEVLRVKLELLQREHRDLDDAIAALDADGRADPLTLRRLKKRKLHPEGPDPADQRRDHAGHHRLKAGSTYRLARFDHFRDYLVR